MFVLGSGPEPIRRRIDFLPGVSERGTFRYTCEGWGLIQLQYGGRYRDELRWSHTNHNSEKRARAWAASIPRLGDPAEWNWPAVTSASAKLNRKVRGMAVSKISSHSVLPHVAQFIADNGLQYEYGTGIHPNPIAA
ncbi:hypothetical protein [Virgisporangium aurantiacum]|uniref:Uncharacterized protein n=1 Tax=Virgisporangium aurantiacum TaxID=175570 RepID=A0A8J4E0A6_9ACTN|nr:hypothetical protein [Virgisporangium aurantiacum]GIJ56784.1 hypothetical protein Vau01_043000 [Virgisporangium aurantiacum]